MTGQWSARYAAMYGPAGTLVRFTFNDGRAGGPEHLTTREARIVRGRPDQVTTDHGTYTAGVHVSRVRGSVEVLARPEVDA